MAETRIKIDAEAEISTTELAAILGVTARRVQQMAQDGTIVPVRRGYFQLGDAVQRYINFLSKPQISEAEQKLETAKRQSEAQLKLSKAQLAKMEVEERPRRDGGAAHSGRGSCRGRQCLLFDERERL